MEKKSQPNSINPSIVSYVDYSLIGSQKYVLRVDDKPFYMTNIQIRLDKLRYKGNNYRIIIKYDAEVSQAAQFQLAAIAGNNAYDHYDMCDPDGDGTMNYKYYKSQNEY